MGNSAKEKAKKDYKLYKEKETNNELNGNDENNSKNQRVKEYKTLLSKYRSCKGNEFKAEVNELFIYETIKNYTIPDNYDELGDFKSKEEPDFSILQVVNMKKMYPYADGVCGGDTHYIYFLKSEFPGTFEITENGRTIKVEIVKKK